MGRGRNYGLSPTWGFILIVVPSALSGTAALCSTELVEEIKHTYALLPYDLKIFPKQEPGCLLTNTGSCDESVSAI